MARSHRFASGAQPLGRGADKPRTHGSLRFGPSALKFEEKDGAKKPKKPKRQRRIELGGAGLAWLLAALAFVAAAVLAYRSTRVDVVQVDLEDGAVLNSEELEGLVVRIGFDSTDAAESATLYFGDEELEDPRIEDDVIIWEPPEEGLAEGEYELRVSVPRLVLGPAAFSWTFLVDDTPPGIEIPRVWDAVPMGEPLVLTGSVDPGSTLEAGSGEVDVDDDGDFRISLAFPPAGPLPLEAVDRAGNRSAIEVIIPVEYPTTRSVHVTAYGWADRTVRGRIIELAEQGRIDAVYLELKDEQGLVGFDTSVERAVAMGAVRIQLNLADAVDTLHSHDVRVIGRITTFQDPVLAGHAWAAGDRDQVIQLSSGQPYGATPHLTNFVHPEVQQYNLDLAVDALSRGVDEIVWDEVRLPPSADQVVPGLDGEPAGALADFLALGHAELRRRGAYQGVITEGLSVHGEHTKGEDVARMARHVDYIVPRVEPIYWSRDLGVANPPSEPGPFVAAYIELFREQTDGSGIVVAPWLQGFGGYGEAQIRAQIDAVAAAGGGGFVVLAPTSTYPAGAFDAD